jgi:hypothetical protein
MPAAPVPDDEASRLLALRSLEVLDSEPESDFDDIVALASEVCAAPISLVTLVDAGRQWFKAKIGAGPEESSRDVSFCAHAILGKDLMVIPDARADARFADNPFVLADPGIRFYAGAPLITTEGYALGTLCVVDHHPHRLSLDQLRALRALARKVTEQLDLRRVSLISASPPIVPDRDVDLAYLVSTLVADLRQIAAVRNTVITLVAEGTPVVRANRLRLGQALDYALFHALQAAPPGGRVAVRVEGTPAIRTHYSGGSIVPAWLVDLAEGQPAAEPLPAAVAAVLRRHGVTGRVLPDPVGTLDAGFELTFRQVVLPETASVRENVAPGR